MVFELEQAIRDARLVVEGLEAFLRFSIASQTSETKDMENIVDILKKVPFKNGSRAANLLRSLETLHIMEYDQEQQDGVAMDYAEPHSLLAILNSIKDTLREDVTVPEVQSAT